MRIAARFLKPPPENSRIEIFNPDKSRVEKNKKTTGWSVFLSAPEKTFPPPANFKKLRTRVSAPRKQIFRKNCHRILNNRAVFRPNFLCPLFAKNFLLR